MSVRHSHLFWGSFSPLGGFAGGGLLIMATTRLAWAITAAGGLLWVYALSSLLLSAADLVSSKTGRPVFPREGKPQILVFLACFIGSLYLLLVWCLCPLAALEVLLPLLLIPLFGAASGLFRRIESLDPPESLFRAASEAAVAGGLLIAFALVREPLGFSCLSLPGGARGIMLIMSPGETAFLSVRVIASSAGGLLLLGYCAGLYRYLRRVYAPREGDQ